MNASWYPLQVEFEPMHEGLVLTILGLSDRNVRDLVDKDGERKLMKLCLKMSTLGNESELQRLEMGWGRLEIAGCVIIELYDDSG